MIPPKRFTEAVGRAVEMAAALDHVVIASGATDPLDVLDVRLAALLVMIAEADA